ncbi:MAG: NapC/NirT family cytochrome c [Coriobacteriia bacterium]|nr:NapC/NirT family cytochrome c [Coriobacteriia bacterium]
MSALLERVQQTWETLQTSLADPASNPLAAILGLAIIVLIFLILVIAAYVIVLGPERKAAAATDVTADSAAAKRQKTRKRDVLWSFVLVGVVFAGLIAGIAYTSTDSFCARCHYTERAFESRAEAAHAGVSCRSCHEAGGVTTYLDAKARGLVNLSTQLTGSYSEEPTATTVADAACLRCHAEIAEETIVARSIKVRHSDIIDAGYHCIECHNTEGHGREVSRPRYPEMRYCIVCHDGSDEQSECSTCHPEDTGVAIRRSRRVFPKTDVVREDCRGCHSMQPCTECHGIELPHTRKFVAGYHARWAYDDLDMCLSCHDMDRFCNDVGCHNFSADIVSDDGLSRVDEQHAELMDQHPGLTAKRCAGCHGDPDVCEYCHGDLPEH